MTARLPVLINRNGGTAAARGDALADEVAAAFGKAGRAVRIELLDGSEIASAVRRHARAPRIVVGGGDGTLSAAAAEMARGPGAMAILPLGTRNHLARQMGVPLDLEGAAEVAVNGQRRRIDLGSVGGRVFVNNASFGLYTRFVRQRDGGDGPKWLKSIPATWHVLRHMRAQHFPLRIDGRACSLATPLLFIGNNRYSLDAGHFGERETMADGELSLCAVSARRPHQLIGFALRALVGLADPARDFEMMSAAREIVIEGSGAIEGAFDGELAMMPLPLTIRTIPGGLGVITPREVAGGAAPTETADRMWLRA